MIDVRRVAGEQWAFRAWVEEEAARRFARLAVEVAELDPDSPVPALLLRATEDEHRHARLCRTLAASYGATPPPLGAETPLAPRALSPRDATLYEMVAACCVAETESVATVTTLLSADLEPGVRETLHEIARDEVNHGRMGWAHLAREAARGDVAFLARHLPAMLRGTASPGLFADGDEPDELLRHGILPLRQKRETFLATLFEVVFPGLARFGIETGPARAWVASSIEARR